MKERPTKVVISEQARLLMRSAHISSGNAEMSMVEADEIHSLALPDDPQSKSVIIAEKHVHGKPIHFLATGFFIPPDTAEIHMILRIPPTLRDDQILPLNTLKRVLESNLGATVTIGTRTGKLIVRERIEIDTAKGTSILNVSAPTSHSTHAGTYFRITEADGKKFADCVLCFALDTTSYLNALRD